MIGNLTSLLVTLKGLPMTYNRDLQEDKEPTFDSVDTLTGSLEVMAGLLAESSFDRKRLEAATVDGFITATDLADYLVQKGVPFRNAHEIIGKIVRDCLDKGRVLSQLSIDELRTFSEHFNEDALETLTVQASLNEKDVPGGTAPARVQDAMEEARAFLDQIDTD
jgi:argininosuccinate lyase